MNWIALYFPRSLSSNQTTDISSQVFEGLSTFSLLSEFHVVMFATISGNKTLFGASLPPDVCRKAHDLITLFVFFAQSGVQHMLCCVGFVLLFCLSSFFVP